MNNIINNTQMIKKINNNYFLSILTEYEINQNELTIILYLSKANEDNNTAKDIVDTFMFAKSHVSSSVNNLLEKGFLRKENDKKKIHLFLTDKSNEIVEKSHEKRLEITNMLLSGFSKEEINQLKQYSNRIYDNIKKYYN